MTMPRNPSPRGDGRPLPRRAQDSVAQERANRRANRRQQRRRRRQIRSAVIGVVLILLLIVLLSRCGGGDDTSTATPNSAANSAVDANDQPSASATPTVEITAANIDGGGQIAAADQTAVQQAIQQYVAIGIDQSAQTGTAPAGLNALMTDEAAAQVTQQAQDVLTDASVGPGATPKQVTTATATLTGGLPDEAGNITVIAARVRINAVFAKEGSAQTISQRAGDLSFIRSGTAWLLDGWDLEVRRAGGGVDTQTQATSSVETDGADGVQAPAAAATTTTAGDSVSIQDFSSDTGTGAAVGVAAANISVSG